jgi:hypothetical protein
VYFPGPSRKKKTALFLIKRRKFKRAKHEAQSWLLALAEINVPKADLALRTGP